MKLKSNLIFFHMASQLSQYHLLGVYLYLIDLWCQAPTYNKFPCIHMFSILFHLSIYQNLLNTVLLEWNNFVTCLLIWYSYFSSLFLFFRIILMLLAHLAFQINFNISLPSCIKNFVGNLIRITLNLYINLGIIIIFYNIGLIHLFESPFNFFNKFLKFFT